MKPLASNLRLPAFISSLLVLPFVILELVNRRSLNEGLPIPLFGILWLLPVAFVSILVPLVRNTMGGTSLTSSLISLLLRIVVLLLISSMWIGIVVDQMPCFLGVPNCD